MSSASLCSITVKFPQYSRFSKRAPHLYRIFIQIKRTRTLYQYPGLLVVGIAGLEPGVAVTTIKIEGIQHEFSTVPGVTEDVSEIILNLKALSAKLYSDQMKTVTIDVKGPCEVKAKDIVVDDELEFVDPEAHIATLNEDAQRDEGVNALLSEIDVLVDGPFLLKERSLELLYCGSKNQRIIDMKKTRETGEAVLWTPPEW